MFYDFLVKLGFQLYKTLYCIIFYIKFTKQLVYRKVFIMGLYILQYFKINYFRFGLEDTNILFTFLISH